jgi:Predicted membrane protein (DUF2231)
VSGSPLDPGSGRYRLATRRHYCDRHERVGVPDRILHPPLIDVPVGAWTTALLLDTGSALSGDRELGAAADRALAVGTIAALPTALTGLNDMRDLTGQSRRIAMVHALVNVIGLSLSTASLAYRHAGRRGLARGLSGLGYLISSTAAHLGGAEFRTRLFDHAEYDQDGDVLYLHLGLPQPGEGEETPEGHVLRLAPGTQRIVGLTVINARQALRRDGRLIVTVPETVDASVDDIAPALYAA